MLEVFNCPTKPQANRGIGNATTSPVMLCRVLDMCGLGIGFATEVSILSTTFDIEHN